MMKQKRLSINVKNIMIKKLNMLREIKNLNQLQEKFQG